MSDRFAETGKKLTDIQELAEQIRDNTGITLATTHVSQVVDNANARQWSAPRFLVQAKWEYAST